MKKITMEQEKTDRKRDKYESKGLWIYETGYYGNVR